MLGYDLGDMASNVTIHAFIRKPFDTYIHDDTHFWNASGVSVNLSGSGISVQLESLRAILLGGIAFTQPRTPPTTQSAKPIMCSRSTRVVRRRKLSASAT